MATGFELFVVVVSAALLLFLDEAKLVVRLRLDNSGLALVVDRIIEGGASGYSCFSNSISCLLNPLFSLMDRRAD